MATVGSGYVQGGKALIAPSAVKYVDRKQISLGVTTPQKFSRVVGPQRIIMTWGTYSWAFSLTGGSNTTQSQTLPMFPRPRDDVYNATIDFRINGADLFPFNCTIITILPIPQNTTLINVFQVTETVTGNNFTFLLAYCPTAGIDSTITYLGAPQVPNFVDMKIVYYRAKLSDSRAFTYPLSYGPPSYYVSNSPTTFAPVVGVNPLDAFTPLQFQRMSGEQTILVSNTTTGFYFAFDVDYGIIGQARGYLGWVNPTANASLAAIDVVNATILDISSPGDPNAVIQVIQFVVAADDGRTYVFTFDPSGSTQVPPTIMLDSPGPVIGAETIVVNVFVRHFQIV